MQGGEGDDNGGAGSGPRPHFWAGLHCKSQPQRIQEAYDRTETRCARWRESSIKARAFSSRFLSQFRNVFLGPKDVGKCCDDCGYLRGVKGARQILSDLSRIRTELAMGVGFPRPPKLAWVDFWLTHKFDNQPDAQSAQDFDCEVKPGTSSLRADRVVERGSIYSNVIRQPRNIQRLPHSRADRGANSTNVSRPKGRVKRDFQRAHVRGHGYHSAKSPGRCRGLNWSSCQSVLRDHRSAPSELVVQADTNNIVGQRHIAS
jgi:hypothetical protein